MNLRKSSLELIFIALFVVSGFAGLIYQSVWSHYLGLILGHAAYAQSLVLAIFMGGMAYGSYLASKRGSRVRDLILAYAIIEGIIGVLGLAFHPIFTGMNALAQEQVLPLLGEGSLGIVYQWFSAALLIAPQCVLLGATFPLLSSALLRLEPENDGKVLGGLYFANSIGAAFGALATGFILLSSVGMPGTIFTAGLLNILVALFAGLTSRVAPPQPVIEEVPAAPVEDFEALIREPSSRTTLARRLLILTGMSGAISFVYEIGWVRLLNQVFGTTVHGFELMLSAFILGLAFGGLSVRQRAEKGLLPDPLFASGRAQIYMGIAALLSIPIFTQSFDWVGFLMRVLARTDEGYLLFSIGTGAIAILVMFPAAFFAGMTLPLFTMALLRRGAGERAIGRIYAANTLGSIVGVLVAVHVLIPLIGVRFAITLGAILDIAIGYYLVTIARSSPSRSRFVVHGAVAAALAFSLIFGALSPYQQASGVFRTGVARKDVESVTIPYLRDGKTATVAVTHDARGLASITTNGKPDAAMTLSLDAPNPSSDESTMILLGLAPLVFHPEPERIAFIGWGSGLSTHTSLGSDRPKAVETIEIEPTMYEGAKHFGERVARAYSDPRSRVHFDDARTYFARGSKRFDVIVSEPSNPWVSGVASLFTVEFYQFLREHLEEDGLLVQWLHAYELTDGLLATMVAALLEIFPDTELYLSNDGDLIFISRMPGAARYMSDEAIRESEALTIEAGRVGLGTLAEIRLRYAAGAALLRSYVRFYGAQPHSDFYPVVSLEAPKARFRGERASLLHALAANGMPFREVLGEHKPPSASDGVRPDRMTTLSSIHQNALEIAALMKKAGAEGRTSYGRTNDSVPHVLLSLGKKPIGTEDRVLFSDALAQLVSRTIGALPPEDLVGVLIEPTWIDLSVQPEEVRLIMAALESVAKRDFSTARKEIESLLRRKTLGISLVLAEQLLVFAHLGALQDGDPKGVFRQDQAIGVEIPPGILGTARAFILAYAGDQIEP